MLRDCATQDHNTTGQIYAESYEYPPTVRSLPKAGASVVRKLPATSKPAAERTLC